jgi:hypothetical protein
MEDHRLDPNRIIIQNFINILVSNLDFKVDVKMRNMDVILFILRLDNYQIGQYELGVSASH